MIDEFLQERAALYVSGTLSPQEREHFELVLEFHHELRQFSRGLAETGASLLLAGLRRPEIGPSPGLKARILEMIQERSPQVTFPGLVVCNLDGLVQWINPAFIEMCGYSLEELRGKRLGPILQGEKTDRATAARLRRAVHEQRPSQETILNYNKSGEPYWVQITMTPILDGLDRPHWLVAREHKLSDPIPS
jgi:PAS domain S-box-containing protein